VGCYAGGWGGQESRIGEGALIIQLFGFKLSQNTKV
jgi:hypothetical protein